MKDRETAFPPLARGFWSILRRDLLLAWKRPGDVLNPLFFFAMVSTLFPLAIGPDADLLASIGPGVIWVAALLAMLLTGVLSNVATAALLAPLAIACANGLDVDR